MQSPLATAEPARAPRVGIDLAFGKPGAAPVVSDEWRVAGWRLRFARLGANQSLAFSAESAARTYVKVITGSLVEPSAQPFPPAREVRSTLCSREAIRAGGEGAWVALFVETAAVAANVRAMSDLTFAGPHAAQLAWQSFAERFRGITPYFDGADAHIARGFHLLDEAGAHVAYVMFWTAGKGVDLSTHDHGNAPSAAVPTFAEVHWVLNNGTGAGGMYTTSAPGAKDRERVAMARGTEHGAFFRTRADGTPQLRANGAVDYPWHGWQAGSDGGPGQAYDFVCAFEINPDFVRL
ncbi:MAG: hypothetical protein FJ091_09680 [Deltaproteobacteria bacterium]|nr:hypothetical protein [Deltaproteobacteria bacterium]